MKYNYREAFLRTMPFITLQLMISMATIAGFYAGDAFYNGDYVNALFLFTSSFAVNIFSYYIWRDSNNQIIVETINKLEAIDEES